MKKLRISASVGSGGVNRAKDVDAVARQLQAIGYLQGDGRSLMSQAPIRGLAAYTGTGNLAFPQPKMSMADGPPQPEFKFETPDWNIDAIAVSIKSFQSIFLVKPDGQISPNGLTLRFLRDWAVKPVKKDANLPGRLGEAWDLVNPLLPKGSYCSSGLRTAEEQRALLQRFYKEDFRKKIIAKYGQSAFDDVGSNMVKNEKRVWQMVNGAGQAISMPGTSKHQFGKAIDIGGPNDQEQAKVIRMVAKANPTLFSGFVLPEGNGCVHFELR